jgi:hypothetical protein
MEDQWDIVIVLFALVGSIALAGVLLARARKRVNPEPTESKPEIAASASRRQRRILENLEPPPQIPTLMDLVREEIEDLGIQDIAGSEGISDPVLLKVYRRDQAVREQCPHNAYEYVVADDVRRDEAGDDDVRLYCARCAAGTDADDETLIE